MNKVEKIVKWVASASVSGISRVMMDICTREFGLSKVELAEMSELIKRDLLHTVVAKVSAAEEQDLSKYDAEVGDFISSASWTDLKRIIHAVNLRLAELPREQTKELQDMLIGEKIVE